MLTCRPQGIGMKLLMKMGFKKGEGLGKSGKGITQALETKLRPKGAGIGIISEQTAVNKEQGKRIKNLHREEGDVSTDETEDEDEGFGGEDEQQAKAQPKEDRSLRWRKGAAKKPKTVYKTADEVAQQGLAAPEKQKIIDMRGPQTRTLVNLDGLSGGIPTGLVSI